MPAAIKPFKAKVFSHSYMALNLSTLETIQFKFLKAVPTFLDQLHMYFSAATWLYFPWDCWDFADLNRNENKKM